MEVAQLIVKILEMEGITAAFGIPGASINGLYKFLGESQSIKHYTHRHEEAAVHAASGYYRASGKLAVALCTSGPGATNFVTGVYSSNIDSIPLIAITGQAVRAQFGKDAFQCVDVEKICKPVAKATYCITDVGSVVKTFQDAFRQAREGKPGVIVIDLPLDVQNADIDYDPSEYQSLAIQRLEPEKEKIEQAIKMLAEAKTPALILGGGVVLANAVEECIRFAEAMKLPIITTYMAKGSVPINHPLNAGHVGIQVGQPIGNRVFLDSDLIIGIGCRFTDRHTGDITIYRGKRRFIHINIEASEFNKIFETDLNILSDAKLALEALLDQVKKSNTVTAAARVSELPALREKLARKTDYANEPINPNRVFYELNKYFDDETVFTTGCGITQIWSGQLQEINRVRHYLPSGGAGCLGYDIPAAFGAAIATGKRTVAVMGDFGFTFHVQELAVCSKFQIPVIVVIVNNAYLGLIRQNQKYGYGYEYAVEMGENQGMIDYVKVAEGFACYGERVYKPEEISGAFDRAVKSGKPAVIDIVCDPDIDCSMGVAINNIREFVYQD